VAVGNYVSAGTETSVGSGIYSPTYLTIQNTRGTSFYSHNVKGFKVNKDGYYRVSIDFVHGGTAPQVYVGYFLSGGFHNKFIAGYTAACAGSGVFFVPTDGEIYLYLFSGNLTTGANGMSQGAAVDTNKPYCAFFIECMGIP
jgi:hypothetical protein